MKPYQFLTIPVALALLSTSAHAQRAARLNQTTPTPSAAAVPAWKQFYLNPKVHVKLDFRNASVDAVLHTLSTASGIAIIKDPSLTGGITLQSPKQQTLGDAFSMLNAVLNLKNFAITKQDNYLLITAKPAGPSFGRFGNGFNPSALGATGTSPFGESGRGAQTVLRVYALKYANATDLAKTINDVFAPPTTQSPAIAAAIAAAAAATGQPVPPGITTPAPTPGVAGAGGFGGRGGRRGRGGFGGGANALDNGIGEGTVKVSADEYSNSLIVNATSTQQDEISDIVDQIDKPTDQPQQAKVFPLQYALASDLEPIVQNVLSGTSPTGRGSTQVQQSNQNNNNRGGRGGNFFQRLFGGNSNSNQNGTVSADTASNSLIVTATAADLADVATVIQTLDKPASYESATFVYQMKNARADVVANLLNESVGNRTTNGAVGGSLTNQLAQSSASTGSLTSSSVSSTTNRAGSASNNFQVTSSNQNQTPATTGIDENGHIINIQNLTGQALFIPSVDTNSIIVVASPQYKNVIMGILQQMDQNPKQVMIQALIVEVSLTKADQYGVEYSFAQNNPFGGVHGLLSGGDNFGLQQTIRNNAGSATVPASTAPQGTVFTLSAANYSLFLQALNTDTTFNVLSSPRIFTTNNATAQINISQSIPYQSGVTVSATTGNTISYDFLNVGIILTVTPLIKDNGFVTMDVNQTANDLQGFQAVSGEPIVNQRETTTTVSVLNGQTVVLGGIIENSLNDTVNKIPILGDIPILGSLFRSTNKTNSKTELLVFLTPHVVSSPEDAAALRDTSVNELSPSIKKSLPTAGASTYSTVLPPMPVSTDSTSSNAPYGAQPGHYTTTGSLPPIGAPVVTVTTPGTAPTNVTAPPQTPLPVPTPDTTAPAQPAANGVMAAPAQPNANGPAAAPPSTSAPIQSPMQSPNAPAASTPVPSVSTPTPPVVTPPTPTVPGH